VSNCRHVYRFTSMAFMAFMALPCGKICSVLKNEFSGLDTYVAADHPKSM